MRMSGVATLYKGYRTSLSLSMPFFNSPFNVELLVIHKTQHLNGSLRLLKKFIQKFTAFNAKRCGCFPVKKVFFHRYLPLILHYFFDQTSTRISSRWLNLIYNFLECCVFAQDIEKIVLVTKIEINRIFLKGYKLEWQHAQGHEGKILINGVYTRNHYTIHNTIYSAVTAYST